VNAIVEFTGFIGRMRRSLIGFSPGLLIIIVCIIGIILFGDPEAFALIGLKEGDKPPAVSLQDPEGRTVDVSAIYGKKPVIFILWELTTNEAFINYSREELRFMNDYYRKYHEKYGLEIIGIYTPVDENTVTEKEIEAVRKIASDDGIEFPLLIDKGFRTFRDFGVIALPSTVMLSRAGEIYFIYPSFPVMARQIFEEKVAELVGLKRPRKVREAEQQAEAVKRSERLYKYALRLYRKGMIKQAISPLKKSIMLDQSFSRSRNLMGILAWMNGSIDSAEKEFAAAYKIDSGNMDAVFNRGLVLLDRDRLDEAEKYFNEVVEGKQHKAQAYYMLGIIAARRGDYDTAEQNLKMAKAVIQRDLEQTQTAKFSRKLEVSILYALASIYEHRGDGARALALLKKAFLLRSGLSTNDEGFVFGKIREFVIYE